MALEAPNIGDLVIFHDSRGNPHKALIIEVFGEDAYPCVNLIYVSKDEKRQDSWGRQVERDSSVVHSTSQNAHGNYWRRVDEDPNPYLAPKR